MIGLIAALIGILVGLIALYIYTKLEKRDKK